MMISIFCPVVFIFLTRDILSQPLEAKCSRYHYEEQTLVKTVNLERIVEEHIQNNHDMETKLRSDFEMMGNEIGKLKERLDEYDKETAKELKHCPSTYMYNEEINLCWKLEKHRKQHWFDARKACSEDGAHLMILNTTGAIYLIQEYLRAEDASNVFVGASDILKEGVYKWIDGDDVRELPWGSGQPSQNRAENCLIMHKGWKYSFGDDYCHGKYQFLCQITLKGTKPINDRTTE